MGNGFQMTLEEFLQQACPGQNAGASDHPAKASASQESGPGLKGKAGWSGKYSDYYMNSGKKIDPGGSSMRTLKECLAQMEDGIMPQSSLLWTMQGMMRNGRISTAAGSCPRTGSVYTLSDIIEPSVPEKYYLSRQQLEKIVFHK